MKFFPLFAFIGVCTTFCSATVLADDAKPVAPVDAPISFFKQVAPIFRTKNCNGCHQPAKRGGEYVMTDIAAMTKGGESRAAAVIPGEPARSTVRAPGTPEAGLGGGLKGRGRVMRGPRRSGLQLHN